MKELPTSSPDISLVSPSIDRDAPIAVSWLAGEAGRNTLRLMGNNDEHNKPSTRKEEQARIQGFIESNDQLTWMIQLQDKIVGTVWVNTLDSDHIPGPAVHIMIGDSDARGRGVGKITISSIIDYLKSIGNYEYLYSRHLVANGPASRLLDDMGFVNMGPSYEDENSLLWQNVKVALL